MFYQDAVWVLPNSPRLREQFQWLTAEISEQGGEAAFWEAEMGLKAKEELLVQMFTEQTDHAYLEILEKLQEPEPDLAALSRQYQQAKARDYFRSFTGEKVREKLLAARGGEL